MFRSRRSFLKSAASIVAFIGTRASAQSIKSTEPYGDKEAADKWMQEWMQAPQAAAGELHLGRFADPIYFLRKEIGWSPNPGQQGQNIRVPVGFVTDFASIPRIFWSLLPPDGLYTYPAIIHDYLYWEQPVSRTEADQIFRYAMGDFKIDKSTINRVYSGVRVGGGVSWSNNATLKGSGEKRILKLFPTDPTIRWPDWRLKPGVLT